MKKLAVCISRTTLFEIITAREKHKVDADRWDQVEIHCAVPQPEGHAPGSLKYRKTPLSHTMVTLSVLELLSGFYFQGTVTPLHNRPPNI